jgi:hypothetical protein
LPEEASARELWGLWLSTLDASDQDLTDIPIYWGVRGEGVAEHAPFAEQRFAQSDPRRDFLTYFTWPIDADGNEIEWTRLPVEDKLWRADRADKGGFIQEVTGWKPSAFQASVNIEVIGRAAGLIV